MKRFLTAIIAACALGAAAVPASATTITTDTFGSNAHVTATTIDSGVLGAGHTFNLIDYLTYIDTTNGHYGQVYTYLPFSVAKGQILTATMTDLKGSYGANKTPDWANIQLFQYTGDDYSSCGSPSLLCSVVPGTYSAGLPSTMVANLVGGVNYLIRIGFGLCGCSGDITGIQLTATVTPIPPALIMFLTALIGLGFAVWSRSGLTFKVNRAGMA